MIININDTPTEVEYIRVFRDAQNIAFYALVGDTWRYFYKMKDKRIPTFRQVEWSNQNHMYGWSLPYKLNMEKHDVEPAKN